MHRSLRDTVVSRSLRLSRDALLAAHGARDLLPSQGPARSSATGSEVHVGGAKKRGRREKGQRVGGAFGERGRSRLQGNSQFRVRSRN